MLKKYLTQTSSVLLLIGAILLSPTSAWAQSSETSLHAPEVGAWVSGPNLPTDVQGETASDFNSDRWKDVHTVFVVSINPFDTIGKDTSTLNPEDFYGMIAEKANCGADTQVRPEDDQFKIVNEVDLPDRENDPAWADSESYDPTAGFIFIDNEKDVAPGNCAWYRFSLMNYDGELSPAAYVPMNLKTSLCSPRWQDSSGKLAAIRARLIDTALAASFDLADCVVFSSMATDAGRPGDFVLTIAIVLLALSVLVSYKPKARVLAGHTALIIILGLLLPLLPIIVSTANAAVRNPNGGTTRGLYYYRGFHIIAEGLAKAWPKDQQAQIQALSYMDSYVQIPATLPRTPQATEGRNYFELYTKEERKAWLTGYIDGFVNKTEAKKFQALILKIEEESGWEAVKIAEGSIRQSVPGTFNKQKRPDETLRPLLNSFSNDVTSFCRSFGPTAQDSRGPMRYKSTWTPYQKEFFYRFILPARFRKHQNEPTWSVKAELPNGSTRYVPNYQEGTQSSSHPLAPYTEYYNVLQLKLLCDSIANKHGGVIGSAAWEDFIDAIGWGGWGLARRVVLAQAVKQAGVEILEGGVKTGIKEVAKANSGRMGLSIAKPAAEEFTVARLQSKFGVFRTSIKNMFGRLNITQALRAQLTRTIQEVTLIMENDMIIGRYVNREFVEAVSEKTVLKKCPAGTQGICDIEARYSEQAHVVVPERYRLSDPVYEVLIDFKEVNISPLNAFGTFRSTTAHEYVHALTFYKGDRAYKLWLNAIPSQAYNHFDEAWTEWFTIQVLKRAGKKAEEGVYANEVKLAQSIYDALVRKLEYRGVGRHNAVIEAEEELARLKFTGEFTPEALDRLLPEFAAPKGFNGKKISEQIINTMTSDKSKNKSKSLNALAKEIDAASKRLFVLR